MKRVIVRIGFILVFGLLVAASCVQADFGKPAKIADQPIDITAKKFTARNVDGGVEAVFEGDVKGAQGDWTLKCDRLVCLFETRNNVAKKGAGRSKRFPADLQAERDIKFVTATGAVEFSQGHRRVTAGKAVYDHAKRTITLTEGPPQFWIEDGEGEAEEVIIHLDEDSVEFKKPKFKIKLRRHEKEK